MSDAALSSVAEPAPEPAQPAREAAVAALYDAFISYSHAKDKALASALQSAMQRLGKPWYRRRALRLFRDDTSLTASPHLWPDIEKALGQSRFLILMASPEAAASPWVDKEVATWLGRNSADTVLIALTDGELAWDGAAGDFHWSDATPLPPALKGAFQQEPRWIDLRPYRGGVRSRDARFADLAADFAATLHGRPKEDLLSQEVRQQRRALRLAGSAVASLLVLLALAGWQWTVANAERQEAERQKATAQHNLAVATDTANQLVFNIVQRFRDLGVPAPVIERILDLTTKLQDQLAQGGQTSPDLRRSQAAALDETAQELLTLGDTPGALAVARKEQAIVQTLLAVAPDNADYRSGLAASYNKIGYALQQQGDLAGALASYRESRAIIRTLVQKNSHNFILQHDLAISDDRIGGVFVAQGDLAGALAAYRESLAITKALVQKDPENTAWQRSLGVVDGEIGHVLETQGDLAGALASYRESLVIMKALAQKDPGNTEWQSDVAVSDSTIGDVLRGQGDLAGALASYRRSVIIIKTLAQSDSVNAEWQRDLAVSGGKIGDLLWAQGDLAGARAQYRESLAIVTALAAKDPGNVQWQTDLIIGLYKLAEAGGDAKSNLTEALAILKRLDAAGKLPPNQEGWIPTIEAALAKATG